MKTLIIPLLLLATSSFAGILDPPIPPLYRTNPSPAALANALNLTTNGGSYRGDGAGLSNLSALNITGLGGLVTTTVTWATNQQTGARASGSTANRQDANPARIVSGFGGSFCFILSLFYIVVVIGSEVLPMYASFAANGFSDRGQPWGLVFSWIFVSLLSLIAASIPMSLALKKVEILLFLNS